MRDTKFEVNLTVKEAYDLLKSYDFGDVIHQELKELGNDKQFAVIIVEKYYIRVKNRVSLVIMIDNIDETTKIKAISSGAGRGVFSNFDWGASDDFENSVQKLFHDYIK